MHLVDREFFQERGQPLNQLGDGLDRGCGIDQIVAGSHRLEQGGDLCGLGREGREQAPQLMSRFPHLGRVLPRDGLLNLGQGTGYGARSDLVFG